MGSRLKFQRDNLPNTIDGSLTYADVQEVTRCNARQVNQALETLVQHKLIALRCARGKRTRIMLAATFHDDDWFRRNYDNLTQGGRTSSPRVGEEVLPGWENFGGRC